MSPFQFSILMNVLWITNANLEHERIMQLMAWSVAVLWAANAAWCAWEQNRDID